MNYRVQRLNCSLIIQIWIHDRSSYQRLRMVGLVASTESLFTDHQDYYDMVHAYTIAIVHACTVAIVHGFTMAIVHALWPQYILELWAKHMHVLGSQYIHVLLP